MLEVQSNCVMFLISAVKVGYPCHVRHSDGGTGCFTEMVLNDSAEVEVRDEYDLR